MTLTLDLPPLPEIPTWDTETWILVGVGSYLAAIYGVIAPYFTRKEYRLIRERGPQTVTTRDLSFFYGVSPFIPLVVTIVGVRAVVGKSFEKLIYGKTSSWDEWFTA